MLVRINRISKELIAAHATDRFVDDATPCGDGFLVDLSPDVLDGLYLYDPDLDKAIALLCSGITSSARQ